MARNPRLHAAQLTGRRRECGVLDQLISAVRAVESQVLVVRGDPGTGKTALLDYLAWRARSCGLPPAGPLSGTIDRSSWLQLDSLPQDARRRLQLAAADPSGDPVLKWRA